MGRLQRMAQQWTRHTVHLHSTREVHGHTGPVGMATQGQHSHGRSPSRDGGRAGCTVALYRKPRRCPDEGTSAGLGALRR
jgi:hypothetical protein